MGPFEPQQALRPRGVFRIAGSSLAALLRSLPSLIGLLLIFGTVSAIAIVAIAVPVMLGNNIDRNVGLNEVGIVIALLMSVVAVPFFLIWGSGTNAALLSLLGARSIGLRQGAGQAYSVGLKRALPLLGTDILFGLAKGIVLLPVLFLWLASAFFFGLARSNAQPAFALVAVPLAAIAAILGLIALHLLLRLLFARFATVFENLGPVASLERAWNLSHRHGLRIFGYVFGGFALIIGAVALAGWGLAGSAGAIQGPLVAMDRAFEGLSLGDGPGAFVSSLGQALPGIALLTLPGLAVSLMGLWFISALMTLYFDMRHRDEGFGRVGGLDPAFEMELEAMPLAPPQPKAVPPSTAPEAAPFGSAGDAFVPDSPAAAPKPRPEAEASGEAPSTADDSSDESQPSPAPWEVASLGAAGSLGLEELSSERRSTDSREDSGATDASSSAADGSMIEAIIPETPVARGDSSTAGEQERSLADAIAHAAEADASPSESRARWRIVDRLLRWLPEAEDEDEKPRR